MMITGLILCGLTLVNIAAGVSAFWWIGYRFRIEKFHLYEISFVSIPSNPDAVVDDKYFRERICRAYEIPPELLSPEHANFSVTRAVEDEYLRRLRGDVK